MKPEIEKTKFNQLLELVPEGNKRLFSQIYFNEEPKSTTMQQVLNGIYHSLGIETNDFFTNKTRKYHYNMGRHIYWFCMRSATSMTLSELGDQFKKDHATVLNGLRKIHNGYQYNNKIRRIVEWVLVCLEDDIAKTIREDLKRPHNIKKNIKVVYLPKGGVEKREYKRYQDSDGYWHENIKIS
jgi:hypothetical protein